MKNISQILILFLMFGCSKEPGDLNTIQPSYDTVTLITTKNNIPADNYFYAEVSAVIKKKATTNDLIVFTVDKGYFSNNSNIYSVNITQLDTVKAYVRYSKSEVVRVTAKIFDKDLKETFVSFLPAYPSLILVNPDSATLAPLFNSKSTIKSQLVRQTGKVSEGMLINYYDSAATLTGQSIGTFLNNTYPDSTGNANVQYSIQDTSYHGFVYIKGYVNTNAGRVLGMNRIYIR